MNKIVGKFLSWESSVEYLHGFVIPPHFATLQPHQCLRASYVCHYQVLRYVCCVYTYVGAPWYVTGCKELALSQQASTAIVTCFRLLPAPGEAHCLAANPSNQPPSSSSSQLKADAAIVSQISAGEDQFTAMFEKYCIVGNFQGRKLSRIGKKWPFRGKNFAEC